MQIKGGWYSRYHIDVEITEDGFEWRITGVYGESKTEEKNKTWKLMRTLKNHSNKPWLMAGDFSEILMQCEKGGGVARPQGAMDMFRNALEDSGLHDLGFAGDLFT